MKDKKINLDSLPLEEREKLCSLTVGDSVTLNGKLFIVDTRCTKGESQSARLLPA